VLINGSHHTKDILTVQCREYTAQNKGWDCTHTRLLHAPEQTTVSAGAHARWKAKRKSSAVRGTHQCTEQTPNRASTVQCSTVHYSTVQCQYSTAAPRTEFCSRSTKQHKALSVGHNLGLQCRAVQYTVGAWHSRVPYTAATVPCMRRVYCTPCDSTQQCTMLKARATFYRTGDGISFCVNSYCKKSVANVIDGSLFISREGNGWTRERLGVGVGVGRSWKCV
jgi:hypothetical protein